MLSVAIVGHGPSPEGRGLGAEIDRADLVVRMHDSLWQTAADWGARWSVGILPGPWRLAAWEADRAPEKWWCYTLGQDAPEVFGGRPVTACDLSWTPERLRRGQMTRGAPSRGLAAALMAIEAGAGRLWLVGCDRLRDGMPAGSAHRGPSHARASGENSRLPRKGPHHFGAERDLLLGTARQRGVAVEFWPEAKP